MNGIRALLRKDTRELASLSALHCLQVRKRGLTRYQRYWRLDLGLPSI